MNKIAEIFENLPYINISEFSKAIGINPSLMRRYVCGECTPSEKQTERILEGIRGLSEEMHDFAK